MRRVRGEIADPPARPHFRHARPPDRVGRHRASRQSDWNQRGETILRILVLGAGGIGGYFGGRLAASGLDVTFLVRPGRSAQLARDGLVITSPLGNLILPVATLQREQVGPGYDVILLSCKSYDLDDAMAAIRPAAPGALIVPLLNGLRHLDRLDDAFGQANVAGGVAAIGATLDDDGTVRHLNQSQSLIFGPRDAAQQARCEAFAAVLARSTLESRLSGRIMQDMWEKFVFLATLAAATCLLRGDVGSIARSDDGPELIADLLADAVATAAAAGYPPRPAHLAFCEKTLNDRKSNFAASMLRDLQRGARVEGDHIVGDMLARARAAGRSATLLRAAYANLQVYQAGHAK
jgi:2-dehydropantoate 2-reductase